MSMDGEETSAADETNNNELREEKYFINVCDSYRQYAIAVRSNRFNQCRRISLLPEKQKAVLPRGLVFGTSEWNDREACFREAELQNQFFFDSMLQYHNEATSTDFHNHLKQQQRRDQKADDNSSGTIQWATDEDISKAQSVLKSIARDWSNEMLEERERCYKPIMDTVLEYIPLIRTHHSDFDKNNHCNHIHHQSSSSTTTTTTTCRASRLVVPGAGVSRLALELTSMGYEVQGNEFSFHMLLASDFILNACSSQRPFTIAPWLGSTKNVCQTLDPIRPVLIPDVDPAEMLLHNQQHQQKPLSSNIVEPLFSMGAGEFVSVYSKPSEHDTWDGVISCFFLDTAPSIIEYFQVIYNLLSENGVFINFGPLLYHWSGPPARPSDTSLDNYFDRYDSMDRRYLTSIDLSWEDARSALINIGFEIIEEKLNLDATYTDDCKSLMSNRFRCIFFVAKKIRNT